jgi:hypothetical protein
VTRRRGSLAVLPILALLLACKGAASGPGAPADFSAAALDRDIFAPSCAFGACHGGGQPAAHLDLAGGLCAAMIARPSCLFPERSLVVPGHPEQSFLIDKLTGENLPPEPETGCATTGDFRMPFGAPPLAAAAIDRVRAWIAAGAPCEGTVAPMTMTAVAPDANAGEAGAPDGGGMSAPAPTLALALGAARVQAGERLTVTLTLTPAAGPDGATIALDASDRTALAVPAAVFAAAGAANVAFDVEGKRPVAAVTITAALDDARAEQTMAVDGLYLAEIFYGGPGDADAGAAADRSQWVKLVNATAVPVDLAGYVLAAGRARYGETVAALAGLLPPGACAVVGGPDSGADNGDPVYEQTLDFSPDIPRPDPGLPCAGVGLFARPPGSAAGDTVDPGGALPVDAVLAGAGNPAGLGGPGGAAAVPVLPSLPSGHSLARQSQSPAAWIDRTPPTPAACPHW